jgi:hypothetical protein
MMNRNFAAAVLCAALVTVGCSDPIAPATPTPVAPTVPEVFSDTLLVSGANTHSFTVTAIGGLQVSMTSLVPAAAVGLGVGTYGVGVCTIIDHIAAVAGASIQLSGTVTVPGTYCVEVYDLGNMIEPAAYTINVIHS